VKLRATDPLSVKERPEEKDQAWTLLQLLSSPSIASKMWAYRQYDSTVRTNTVIGPGGDAAVWRLRGTRKAVAMKVDGNGRYVYLDPRVGGRIAVAESARNVACTGARPLAITNCLNFGNPTRPAVYFQLREAILGIGEACTALGTPVTGGNVSLYNESASGAVFPTPVIGMIGLIDDLDHITRATFAKEGDSIVLLGNCTNELGASEYLSRIHGITAGPPPDCDLAGEKTLIDALLEAIREGIISSAHDCSDGGLAVALAECCIANRDVQLSAEIDLNAFATLAPRALLFGEAQGRIIVSTAGADRVIAIAKRLGVVANEIGRVRAGGESFTISTRTAKLSVSLKEMSAAYHDAIPKLMSRAPSDATLIEHVTVGSV
jgi:phosphoribosylformylglycinamidine synthase